MTALLTYPSVPQPGEADDLGTVFPDYLIDAEQAVYEYVLAAAAGATPMLSFYADRRTGSPQIPVVRGWPIYPGKVPAIGVAAGPETDDQAQQMTSGGYVDTLYAYTDPDDQTSPVVGTADYYAEPLYSPVIVELIHENRDERDRLHNELRRALFPMRRKLPAQYSQVKKVTIDMEKTDQHVGEESVSRPLTIYVTIATVHVYHEMLQAEDVRGPDSVIATITPTVAPA